MLKTDQRLQRILAPETPLESFAPLASWTHPGTVDDMDVAKNPAIERLDPRLRLLYKSATPGQKLAVVGRLNAVLIALKTAELAQSQPVLSAERQRELLRRWWLTARD